MSGGRYGGDIAWAWVFRNGGFIWLQSPWEWLPRWHYNSCCRFWFAWGCLEIALPPKTGTPGVAFVTKRPDDIPPL